MAEHWKNTKTSGLPPSYHNYNNRYSPQSGGQALWTEGSKSRAKPRSYAGKLLWQGLCSMVAFAMILAVFQSQHPQAANVEQAIRTWFTVDSDLTTVTKMFAGMGLSEDSFDRAGYEVVKANAVVAQIHEEMVVPVAGKVTSAFGWSEQKGQSGFNQGIIIETKAGEAVKAAYGGTVLDVQLSKESYIVSIAHSNGLVTTYGNCSQVYVKPDQIIEKGEIIGLIGEMTTKTGHLYFETKHLGEPVDPLSLLKGKEV